MTREKYIITPYIVELMQSRIPFIVFHDNHQLLEGDEVAEWINNTSINGDGLLNEGTKTPYMIGRWIEDKHGRSGYAIKNTNGSLTLTIPDAVIFQGYEAVKENAKENDIILLTPHEWKVNKLRRSVAHDIANEDLPYGKILEIFDRWDVFNNWEDDEFYYRPVDVDALREAVEQEMGL